MPSFGYMTFVDQYGRCTYIALGVPCPKGATCPSCGFPPAPACIRPFTPCPVPVTGPTALPVAPIYTQPGPLGQFPPIPDLPGGAVRFFATPNGKAVGVGLIAGLAAVLMPGRFVLPALLGASAAVVAGIIPRPAVSIPVPPIPPAPPAPPTPPPPMPPGPPALPPIGGGDM